MKIGFIGAGNMGSAIIDGLVSSGQTDIIACDLNDERLLQLKAKGVEATKSIDEVCDKSDVVILAVKPNAFETVLTSITNTKPIFVSIAAGISICYIKKYLGEEAKVVRAMPNTPALIGKGVTALCFAHNVTEVDVIKGIFDNVGVTEIVSENLMDAVVAASGSSPAYVYMLIEAMADAAVSEGLTREKAYKICAAAVAGSAEMVLKTGKHPGELKDMVCSPGGTTIDAVASLECDGFRSAVIKAMEVCAEKSRKLTK